jgi:hypothetical protein
METQHVILSQDVSIPAFDKARMRDLTVRSLYFVQGFNDFKYFVSFYTRNLNK